MNNWCSSNNWSAERKRLKRNEYVQFEWVKFGVEGRRPKKNLVNIIKLFKGSEHNIDIALHIFFL